MAIAVPNDAVCRDMLRPVGQEAKTPPFHGGNMGSIPVRVTKKARMDLSMRAFLMIRFAETNHETRRTGAAVSRE